MDKLQFGCFAGILFPVLDILRLVVRDATANKHLCDSQSNGPRLVDYACAVFNNSLAAQPKNQLLMLRALCNVFQHAAGKQLMLDSSERLLASAKMALQGGADKLLEVRYIHCQTQKKGATIVFPIASPNVDRFSKFFQYDIY